MKVPMNIRGAVSRRDLGRLLLPSAGAALGSGLFAPGTSVFAKESQDDERGMGIYNVRGYGATGDGKTLDTQAVQRAIDACYAGGGGTVLVPAGTFVIGTVELKSNITLHVASGGKLLGSGEGKYYREIKEIPLHGDTTLGDGNWALFFAVDAKNVTIEGAGTIDGQGAKFRSMHGTPAPSGLDGERRPYHILLYRCEGVFIRNISLMDSAYHSVRIIQSIRVHIDSVYIHNRVNGNNDGFHFISAQNVMLSNCTVKAQDDACAMFGSCRNITIMNCFFSTRWSVFRFGGGYAENIVISNCILDEVYGCAIKFQGDGDSRFENISFSNLVLKDVTGPISMSLGGADGAKGGSSAVARNISFSHLRGTVIANVPDRLAESDLANSARPGERNSCIVLNAVHGAILENITFDNVHLTFGGGGTAGDASAMDIPQTSGEYFKLGTLPAYAMYARNARGITLQNVRFQTATPDMRPAIVCDGVEDMAINGLSVQAHPKAESVVRLIDSRQILLSASRVLTPGSAFLQIEGSSSEGIIVDGGDLSKVASPVTLKRGAEEKAVRLRDVH
jgi:hypothetical protein